MGLPRPPHPRGAHGGKARWNNLALACSRCNRNKGTNILGFDNRLHEIVRLIILGAIVGTRFPVAWAELYRRDVGRLTSYDLRVLAINHPKWSGCDGELIAQGVSRRGASGSALRPPRLPPCLAAQGVPVGRSTPCRSLSDFEVSRSPDSTPPASRSTTAEDAVCRLFQTHRLSVGLGEPVSSSSEPRYVSGQTLLLSLRFGSAEVL